jgi:hypothetical protein
MITIGLGLNEHELDVSTVPQSGAVFNHCAYQKTVTSTKLFAFDMGFSGKFAQYSQIVPINRQ